MGNRYVHGGTSSPCRSLTNDKEENSNFVVKAANATLTQESK